MTARVMAGLVAAVALALSGCGQRSTDMTTSDPAKLDVEMEKAARDIESRADAAAEEVERQAAAELARIEAEAKSALADTASGTDRTAEQAR